ncbi:MAG: dynamin family protein [Woronichinia naegeliana WA131]|uniref:Dynamin family protein n=1 Tax=Woronichinia naegeliana WA131 TaxID=2824559 RepID=A0A977KXT6_9CYAN|nr:MAG: dynamin family protein [Woronichinia naegeliana WA131]
MNEGVALLRDHDRLLVENQSDHRLDAEIQAINENLRLVNESLKRVKLGELTMTIVAPTSAGKSTVINAIAGQDLLPSRNDAMTVLPTEIVFSHEVTCPKLILDKALMTLLREAWRHLHEKLQRIGLDEAIKLATKNDFPRENAIKEILNSSSVSFQSEVVESNGIQVELTKINDLLRLCGIFGISTEFLSSLSQIPRIEVPFPSLLSPLKDSGLGTLVLVDTPGPSEDKSLDLVNVVKDRLKASSLVLVVVDYTKIGQTDPAKVKKLVDEIAVVKGRDRIYIIVNKIDARDPNNPEDLTTQQILNLVKTKYEIDDPQNRVFEMSAIKGFLATNFQREKEIYQSTELRNSKSFEVLGQKYYNDSWEDRKEDISLSEMDKVANKYWQKSGFADFMEKAITPLVPSMITIKSTLNENNDRFTSFSSCLKKYKEILERDIQRLEIEINQLEIEIIAINSHITNIFELKKHQILSLRELNVILEKESHKLHTEISSLAYILIAKATQIANNLKNWSTANGIATFSLMPVGILTESMVIDHHNKELDKELSVFQTNYSAITECYCNQLTNNLLNMVKQIIERINNNYSGQDELVLSDVQKRFHNHKIVRCDVASDTYGKNIISYEKLTSRLKLNQVRLYGSGIGTKFAYVNNLLSDCNNTLEIFQQIGQDAISTIERSLTKDIDTFTQQRVSLFQEYEMSLQSTIQTNKKIQNDYTITVSQYKRLLDKIANLEIDLKYQQEYIKQH